MIDLIPLEKFGKLRLAHFVPVRSDVTEFDNWEYMEDRWVGEGLGAFTEFLCLEEDPDTVRAICLDLGDLPTAVGESILAAVRLPLRAGMGDAEVRTTLGTPRGVQSFVPEQHTYEFRCGPDGGYEVSCTMHERAGLTYVTVLGPTPRRLASEDLEAEA